MSRIKSHLKQQFPAEWMALRNAFHRCHNKDHAAYIHYGARGIEVCEAWRGPGAFALFIDHIGPRPSSSHSLDRINNDGNYEPDNVRWADRKTQQNNRRPHRSHVSDLGWGIGKITTPGAHGSIRTSASPLLPFNGEIKTLAEWAKITNIKASTIRARIRRGLAPEVALSTKPSRAARKPTITIQPTIH